MLPTVWLLFQFGAERGIKAIAFIVPVITFTTGLIIGLVKAKRDWKKGRIAVGGSSWLPAKAKCQRLQADSQ